jgi:hypothetical protein
MESLNQLIFYKTGITQNGKDSEWKDSEWKDSEWKDSEWKDSERYLASTRITQKGKDSEIILALTGKNLNAVTALTLVTNVCLLQKCD